MDLRKKEFFFRKNPAYVEQVLGPTRTSRQEARSNSCPKPERMIGVVDCPEPAEKDRDQAARCLQEPGSSAKRRDSVRIVVQVTDSTIFRDFTDLQPLLGK